jgi:hypothetical protein
LNRPINDIVGTTTIVKCYGKYNAEYQTNNVFPYPGGNSTKMSKVAFFSILISICYSFLRFLPFIKFGAFFSNGPLSKNGALANKPQISFLFLKCL